MIVYEVRKSDEMGHDYLVETFTNQFAAYEFELKCSRLFEGWHYYTKEVKK